MSNSRRESFLRELADPAWPMRKLNRSVPHTISGRVLLDQCLAKNIPIPRAVWLAKCIGANDIRAFKRKSAASSTTVSSEAKWIKDWTIHVEQFLKAVVTTVGEKGWKSRLEYALRLCSHLFAARLLDDDHYLDCIITSLDHSAPQHLPFWLLNVQIYWSALTATRYRGRRLAETLLKHLDSLKFIDADNILSSATSAIETLIARLALENSACLILPKTWPHYAPLIRGLSASLTDTNLADEISVISRRNDRLQGDLHRGSRLSNARDSIIRLLDQHALDLTPRELITRCFQTNITLDGLVTALLHWCSTVHRAGHYRVYIVARALRLLKRDHESVDEHIWAAVQFLPRNSNYDANMLFYAVIELVRSRHFSVGLLTKHLISTGAITAEDSKSDLLVQLFAHLPLEALTPEVLNLRNSLLGNSDAPLHHLHQSVLEDLSGISNNIWNSNLPQRNQFSSITLRAAFGIGHMIRQHLLAFIESKSTTEPEPWTNLDNIATLEALFLYARKALEDLREYACLADVLGSSLGLHNQQFLTSVIHTMHHGRKSYIAIGAMTPLFDSLIWAYDIIKSRQPLLGDFCSALLHLAKALRMDDSLVARISSDLMRCEHLAGAAICSPASDNAGDLLQVEKHDADDDIERILISGTTMEAPVVERVFHRIFQQIALAYESVADTKIIAPFGNWLARLRSFDRHLFDKLLRDLLLRHLASVSELQHLYGGIFPAVIGSCTMTLKDFVELVQTGATVSKMEPTELLDYKESLLMALFPGSCARRCSVKDGYKLDLELFTYLSECPSSIIRILEEVFQALNQLDVKLAYERFESIMTAEGLQRFLIGALATSSQHREDFSKVIHATMAAGFWQCSQLVDKLLDSTGALGLANLDFASKIGSVINSMDELSIPFSALCLQFLQGSEAGLDSSQIANHLLETVLQKAADASSICYLALSETSSDTKAKIYALAESHILDTVVNSMSNSDTQAQKMIGKYAEIAMSTVSGLADRQEFYISTEIINAMRHLASLVSSDHDHGTMHQEDMNTRRGGADLDEIAAHMGILLTITILRRKALGMNDSGVADPAIVSVACSSLLSLLACTPLQQYQSSYELLYDVVLMLYDELTDEQKMFLPKFEGPSNAPVNFLQSPSGARSFDGWLGLVMPQITQPNASAFSTPSSQTSSQRQGLHGPNSPSVRQATQAQVTARGAQQATAGASRQSGGNAVSAPKLFMPPVQYPLKYWELLPDQGSNGTANDTAISLGLFGTRKA